jgi:hypothetical protein
VSYNINATAVKLFNEKCTEAARKTAQLRDEEGFLESSNARCSGILGLFGQERPAQSFSMPRIQELGLMHTTAPSPPPPPVPVPSLNKVKSTKQTSVEAASQQPLQININSLFSEKGRSGQKTVRTQPDKKVIDKSSESGEDSSNAFIAQDAHTAQRLEKLKQQYLRYPNFKPVFKQKL